jgi:membrane glycosyltransferase
MTLSDFNPARLDPRLVARRRALVVTLLLVFTGPAALLMADLHWRTGYDALKWLHLFLFVGLFGLVSFGAVQALIGFVIRRRGGDSCSISRSVNFGTDTDPMTVPVAVVMPICNEEVRRVIEGFRAAYESVVATGKLPECDFFLLSDSTNPNNWVEEESAWLALTQQLHAHGRIFYRKRRVGINKKAGNIADFCRRWGKSYRYMVVLDADSIVTGEAIVKLVRLMERNRRVGLIQGVPLLINGETILARLQQFASRLYGPIFSAGLNYWQLSEANYWGHNAMIRLAPFIRHCSLPELPGDGPFGGRILSHDYVEAALMRRAGWQVWLATNLEGNYEECPGNVIDLAKRDRRWLQGNLQHAKLIVARGFHFINRIHFSLGILAYLASPLWLAFLVLSALIAWRAVGQPAPLHHVDGFAGLLRWSYETQALVLFAFTTALLFLPKVIALFDLRARPGDEKHFGGWPKIFASVFLETGIFTLLAPVLMVFHTKFVVLTLCRQSISWGSQRRGRDGASAWSESVNEHWGHTCAGIIAAALVWHINPILAAWMSPVLAGLIFSIPLSYWTGSLASGEMMQRHKIFQTPEESAPLPEVTDMNARLAGSPDSHVPSELLPDYGLLQAALDPFVNAAHLALLRTKDEQPMASETHFAELREKLLKKGPTKMTTRDKVSLLMDSASMTALHEEIWSTPSEDLAEWWQRALNHYNFVAPAPTTAFSRAAA